MKSEHLKSLLLLAAGVLAFVLVPFLYWHGVWFGRPLVDSELTAYLKDEENPRKIQHALTQLGERIAAGDAAVRPFYPAIARLAGHPRIEIRNMAAWVMGQDPTSPRFSDALRELLHDPALLVRRNAALALVRFGDSSGAPILRGMLEPHTVRSAAPGTVSYRVREGVRVEAGAELARITGERGNPLPLAAPVGGRVEKRMQREGSRVGAGQALLVLAPDPDHAWEALRALYLVGGAAELEAVQRLLGQPDLDPSLRHQALSTLQAISDRLASEAPGR